LREFNIFMKLASLACADGRLSDAHGFCSSAMGFATAYMRSEWAQDDQLRGDEWSYRFDWASACGRCVIKQMDAICLGLEIIEELGNE